MNLFEKSEINIDRQPEVDLAKFICLFGMVIVHCFEIFVSYSVVTTSLQYILIYVLDFIFGAPTFMFCMGIGIAYSRRSTPSELMKRGLKIFLLGYLLNVFCSLGYLVLLRDVGSFVVGILGLDIMQFAGLALILFGFLKFLKTPDWGIGIIAAAMSVLGTVIRTVDLGNSLANVFLGLLIGTFDYEWMTGGIFPLVNWFIFVVAGYYFAKLLKRCAKKAKLYGIFSSVAAVVLLVYMLIAIPRRLGMMGSVLRFHHMWIHEALVCIAGAVFALGFYYAITRILPRGARRVVLDVSKNINTVYCLQWVIIAWTAMILFVLEKNQLSDGVLVVLGIVIFLISAGIAHFYGRLKSR